MKLLVVFHSRQSSHLQIREHRFLLEKINEHDKEICPCYKVVYLNFEEAGVNTNILICLF